MYDMENIIEYTIEQMGLHIEKKHINWIESLWNYTKRRLNKTELLLRNSRYISKNLNLDLTIEERKKIYIYILHL